MFDDFRSNIWEIMGFFLGVFTINWESLCLMDPWPLSEKVRLTRT